VCVEHHLYRVVAEYLLQHPTTPEDPLKLPIRGLPLPEGPLQAPSRPRGWRINEILPLHSAAMTGGGVSENMLRDFQAAMQGQEPGSASSAPESSSKKKKKDKGKKK
jgi:signal recognition particle subunit SRP19